MLALFPSTHRNPDGTVALTYQWFHSRFTAWVDSLDIGHCVPHQGSHTLATNLLRAGASLTHIRTYLGQVSDQMAEHYVHLSHSDLEDVLQHVWVAGPGAANPGEVLAGHTTPMNPKQPKRWPSTCHGGAPRPRAASAPFNPSSTAALAPGAWTATTATSSSSPGPT